MDGSEHRARPDPKWVATIERGSKVLGALVLALGTVVLAGWALNVPTLQQIAPGYSSMKANAALGFVLGGGALLIAGRSRSVSAALGAMVFAVGAATLAQYIVGTSFGVDELLFSDVGAIGAPGRMAPTSAACFTLAGAAIVSAAYDRIRLAHSLAVGVFAAAFVALLGYIFDVSALYRISSYTSMALHSSLAFLILASAILAARPVDGLTAVFANSGAAGLIVRRVLPLAVLLPVLSARLVSLGVDAGVYDGRFAIALDISVAIALLTILILWSAHAMSDIDLERREAQNELQLLNIELEQEVAERTAELSGSEARFRSIAEAAKDGIVIADDSGAIRETEVAAGEAGGITQHIGAYQVHHGDKLITFLDTPGHEAFTAMRARGAQVTDIAVIVVAADDGVKPQTREAVDHAKAAEVPILVAVNKIDKEGAQPDRVRTEMTTLGLQPEEWGGETMFVDVSAKAKTNLEDLLESIILLAEVEELKANPDAEASGVVIESKLDPGRGAVVTVLVNRGTMKVGDALVAGAHWGRVRALHDYKGRKVKEATPSEPVEVLGFDTVPEAGEYVRVVENDRRARQLAQERGFRLKSEAQARRSQRTRSLATIFEDARGGTLQELNLVLKADVSGSLEAFEDEIAKLPQSEVQVQVVLSGVGGITESDVMLAAASDAIVMGFNVRPVGEARQVADREGVEIRTYSVIYRAIDELRDAMQGMLAPEEVEESIGSVEVRAIFRASRVGTIAGCYVTDGKVTRGAKCRLVRDGTIVYDGEVDSLRRGSDDVREVAAGFECGIVLRNYADVKEGDVIEVYDTRQVERTLS
jgi:translation initiation factor IF-2